MKKLTAFALALVCVSVMVGCDNDSRQTRETRTANTHTIEVTENSVGETGRGTFDPSVEISEDDANTLSEIINSGTWEEGPADRESDCVIKLKGHWTYYNSDSGILSRYDLAEMSIYSSKKQEVSGKSSVLSEEDRITVNAILEKYIALGIGGS
ncbi:MAG: hypothetical protein ILP09_05510 [Oscillospiraceae bacterium]|nr:hypothetical protein [Oscillospiraceae bacterium]